MTIFLVESPVFILSDQNLTYILSSYLHFRILIPRYQLDKIFLNNYPLYIISFHVTLFEENIDR